MARVTLVVGLQYVYKNRTFLKDQTQVITAPEDLDYFRDNGHFKVDEDRTAVAADPVPKKPTKPVKTLRTAPITEVEEDSPPEEVPGDEEVPEGAEEEEQLPETDEVAGAEESAPEPEPEPVVTVPVKKGPRKGQFQKGGKRA
jgi:hypothetical protein